MAANTSSDTIDFTPDTSTASTASDGIDFTPDSEQKPQSQTTSTIPEAPIGQRIINGLKDTASLVGQGITNAPQEGTFNTIVGGPGINFEEAVKRAVLNKAIPGNDLVTNSFREAIQQGTNPATIMSAMVPADSVANAIKSKIDFGGNKALTQIAQDAKDSLTAANEAFKKSYSQLFEKVGDKVIPDESKSQLLNTATNALDQTAPGSVANNFLSKKLPEILDDPNIDVENLHAIKGQIYKQAKSSIGVEKNALMKVYGDINNVLSSDNLGGQEYADLTSQQHDFFNNEANYVKKLVLDPINKNNVTNQKLQQFNLSDNYKDALTRLSNRPTSTGDLMGAYEAVRRGNMLKSAIIKYSKQALLTGAEATGGIILGKKFGLLK